MRIDFVITELFVGGAERCLTELAIGLADAGDDIRVFSLGSIPEGDQRILVDRLEQHQIKVTSANANSVRSIHRAYRSLKDWFGQSPPDLVQTFLYHANVIGTQAARSAGVPICVGGLRVAESNRWRCGIERYAAGKMDSVICVSQGVREFARRHLRCSDEQLVVIPNGVDVDRFALADPFRWPSLGWPSDAVVSLFVGRLHPQKGIERIQQQIDVLAPPGSPRRLLIVGEGPLRSELEQWAERIGDDRVRLMPWQSDVAPLIKACRVLILPSHYEGMPNIVLEAMAAARPVVCSRVEGADELLAHRLQEQSFPPDDAHAMKNLIEPFLLDEVWSDQVGRDNQQRVEDDFSLDAMVSRYREHYRELRVRRLE